jgi:hypothetical protein
VFVLILWALLRILHLTGYGGFLLCVSHYVGVCGRRRWPPPRAAAAVAEDEQGRPRALKEYVGSVDVSFAKSALRAALPPRERDRGLGRDCCPLSHCLRCTFTLFHFPHNNRKQKQRQISKHKADSFTHILVILSTHDFLMC